MRLGFVDEPGFSWIDFIKAFLYLLGGLKKRYFLLTVLLTLINFYTLVPAFIVGRIVDFFSGYHAGSSLIPFYLLVVILTVCSGVAAFIRLTTKNAIGKIQSQMSYNTRVTGFEKLLDFSLKWHDHENTGNKVQKIQNGTDALNRFNQIMTNGLVPQVTTIFGVLLSFLLIKPLLFFYCLLYLSLYVSIQIRYYKKQLQMNNEYNQLIENSSGTYYEGLSNILTIKTLGVKSDFKKNITSKEELSRDYSIKMLQFGTDKWKWFQLVNAISLGGMLLLLGQVFITKIITLGAIFIYFNYFRSVIDNIGDWTSNFDQLLNIKVSLARMMPIFTENVIFSHGKNPFPNTWDSLTFDQVDFTYTTEEAVKRVALHDLSFSIKRYEKIGIVGRSGSGKSTLAKVLLGLYPIESGTYTIGHETFSQIDPDAVTRHISLVLQDSEMFNLSLRDNITLMREYNEDLFQKAISISQLESLIEKLPEGIETLIGEKGYRLSGGERQRIGIARAIYKDPEILILDEATSSLDSKTEQLIQTALEELLEKKTVISIAHRISTLTHADRIFVFKDGAIIEDGTYKELSENSSSHFAEISKHQTK